MNKKLLVLLLIAIVLLVACDSPGGQAPVDSVFSTPAVAVSGQQVVAPAVEATPPATYNCAYPPPEGQSCTQTFDWGSVNWHIDPSLGVGAVALAISPAIAVDGPAPVADLVVAGIIFYVWVANDGPQTAATVVVQGYNGLVEFGQSTFASSSVEWTEAEALDIWSAGYSYPSLPNHLESVFKHPEWRELFENLATHMDGQSISPKGDGRSNGSIQIWLGVGRKIDPNNGVAVPRPDVATVILVVRKGPYTHFIAFDALVVSETIEGAWLVPGTSVWLHPDGKWVASWIMTRKAKNGHGRQPVEYWMTVRYADRQIKWILDTKYFSVYPVTGNIPLPPLPLP